MKTEEITKLEPDELEKQLATHREELLNLRFQQATGALENSSRLKHVKRTVARLLTVQNERRRKAR